MKNSGFYQHRNTLYIFWFPQFAQFMMGLWAGTHSSILVSKILPVWKFQLSSDTVQKEYQILQGEAKFLKITLRCWSVSSPRQLPGSSIHHPATDWWFLQPSVQVSGTYQKPRLLCVLLINGLSDVSRILFSCLIIN